MLLPKLFLFLFCSTTIPNSCLAEFGVDPLVNCPESDVTFELTTGFVFTAPDAILDTRPGVLKIEACIQSCRKNVTCRSVNYETGLCVLFSSSAESEPDSLTPSQFPVFTIYAQKVCVRAALVRCPGVAWIFDRVQDHALEGVSQKVRRYETREACMASCLSTTTFTCRSANYDSVTGECSLSDLDRHSTSSTSSLKPTKGTDYLESNCAVNPVGMCQFRPVKGRILKTVDSVFQNVKTIEECRQKCIEANYRCHSYDYGDTGSLVCRLSHHTTSTLLLINEPYLEAAGSTTYEMGACYNVSVECQGSYMVARVKTNRVFSGKMYGKTRPNSCQIRVDKRLDFQLYLGYNDLDCEVNQEVPGKFATDIIIQHHDMVVTTNDIGLKLRCNYNLSNRTISHAAELEINEGLSQSGAEQTIVQAPNITMRITDRNGNDITSAQVGDHLALRFEILDRRTSPYEIFVRELVASDGIDASEILLVDAIGCPTDYSLMGVLQEFNGTGQVLHADFDAFKFPTSSVVQFRALVTPCIPRCDPVECDVTDYHGDNQRLSSFGRRKRRSVTDRRPKSLENDENVMVAGVIHISDKFELGDKKSTSPTSPKSLHPSSEWNDGVVQEDCGNSGPHPEGLNTFGFAIGATLFLLAQCVLIAVWICLYHRQKSLQSGRGSNPSSSTTDDEALHSSFGNLFPSPPGLSGKIISPDGFRDYNPYTADLFRRRPVTRETVECEEENNNNAAAVETFPSIHSISSVDSSLTSVGTTMYSSLVNPSREGNCKSNWARRNLGAVFSGPNCELTQGSEENGLRKA